MNIGCCADCRYWERVVVGDDPWELNPVMRRYVGNDPHVVEPLSDATRFGLCSVLSCIDFDDTCPLRMNSDGGVEEVFTPEDWGCVEYM